jgi:hypothetical protein
MQAPDRVQSHTDMRRMTGDAVVYLHRQATLCCRRPAAKEYLRHSSLPVNVLCQERLGAAQLRAQSEGTQRHRLVMLDGLQ